MRFPYPNHHRKHIPDHTDTIQDYDMEERMLSCHYVHSNVVFLGTIEYKEVNPPNVSNKFVMNTPNYIAQGKKPIIRG